MGKGKREVALQWVESISYRGWMSFRDLVYKTVYIVNNTDLCRSHLTALNTIFKLPFLLILLN